MSRPPRERLAAWLVTGPLGHLYGTLADIVVLWARYGRLLAVRRVRRMASGRRNIASAGRGE